MLEVGMHVSEKHIHTETLFDSGTMRDHVLSVKQIRQDCILGTQLRRFQRKRSRSEAPTVRRRQGARVFWWWIVG